MTKTSMKKSLSCQADERKMTIYELALFEFSREELEEFQAAFSLFDEDESGAIDAKELGHLMKSLGHKPTQRDLKDMIEEVDWNQNGMLEFEEFIVLMAKIMNQLKLESGISSEASSNYSAEEELTEAFQFIDKNLEGVITDKTLQKFVDNLGERLNDVEIDDMINTADRDNDGVVNFRDFENTMDGTVETMKTVM